MSEHEPMIKAISLSYRYGIEANACWAMDKVDLEIKKGSFVAILGHNGSGKSTLVKHFNALLLPQGGAIYIDGMNSREEKEVFNIRRSLGMVMQNPDNQLVAAIVEEDVAFGLENLALPAQEIQLRTAAALKAVGMYEQRKAAPHMLSGGEKQRLAIAGIIAMRPQCIVFDEATAMLDPVGRKEILKLAHKLNQKYGITVCWLSHHVAEAVNAERVIVMAEGKILLDDTPEKVFSAVEQLQKAKLAVPETVELLYKLNQLGCNFPLQAFEPRQCAAALYQYFGEEK